MKRPISITTLLAATAMTAFASPASASDAAASFSLRLRVPLYCILEGADTGPLQLIDGAAELGLVREVCNRASGHDIRASFSNLAEGQLEVEGERFAVEFGEARMMSAGARARTTPWRLVSARAAIPDAPILMRVSITPR